MTPDHNQPPSPLLALAGGLLFVLVAVLAAVVEVLLVPVRVGTVVVPLTVLLAVATMIGVPVLAGIATGRTLGAALPVIAWIVTVIVLSQSRPEGDVLLVGSAPLVYVTYALLVLGAVAGIATVLAVDRRRLSGQREALSAAPPARAQLPQQSVQLPQQPAQLRRGSPPPPASAQPAATAAPPTERRSPARKRRR